MTAQPRAPAVYAGLTQDELDRAYDQDRWAANGAEVQASTNRLNSPANRRSLRMPFAGPDKLGQSGMPAGRNHCEMLEDPNSPVIATMMAGARA